MPLFSVIIPNFNHAPFLKERIDSILNQTYVDLEIILLDDNSTDNSKEILEEYCSNNKISHLIVNEKNSGSPVSQWQKGIHLAKGDWIWIAESDDIADSHFLEECANCINSHPKTGLVYCDSNIFDVVHQQTSRRFSDRKNSIFKTVKWSHAYWQSGIHEINECLKYDCTVNNVSAAVFKKELALQILDGALTFRYYADWYCFLRLCLLSGISYIPKALNTYRFHSQSLLNAETSLIISTKEYFKILKLLYYNNMITNRKKLLTHFAYNYLAFGILKDGPRKMFAITRNYFAIDKTLAFKVILRVLQIKLFNKRYKAKFEINETSSWYSQLQ